MSFAPRRGASAKRWARSASSTRTPRSSEWRSAVSVRERRLLPVVSVQGPARGLEMSETVEGARKPPWLKVRMQLGPNYSALKNLVRREGVHTICEEASCPNIYECWEEREA